MLLVVPDGAVGERETPLGAEPPLTAFEGPLEEEERRRQTAGRVAADSEPKSSIGSIPPYNTESVVVVVVACALHCRIAPLSLSLSLSTCPL